MKKAKEKVKGYVSRVIKIIVGAIFAYHAFVFGLGRAYERVNIISSGHWEYVR